MSETREDVDKMQGTLVFFDLETNGLIDRDGRGNIHHYPDIIELAMVAVSRESIEQNHPIRAIDKCVRCFRTDKNIPQTVRNITKMTPEILKNKPNFEKEDALQIKAFLDRQQGPVKLLAYNGDDFDFPLLKHWMEEQHGVPLPENVMWCDTWKVIKSKFPHLPSYKLENVARRFFGSSFQQNHFAEDDANTLLKMYEKQPDLLKVSIGETEQRKGNFIEKKRKQNRFSPY